MLCYVMSCYVMVCYGMLWYVIVCYGMLWYVMVCYGMLSKPARAARRPEGPVRCKHRLFTDRQSPTVGLGKTFWHIGRVPLENRP